MRLRICVEINGVFYESLASAGKVIRCDHNTIKYRCLSNNFPNYKIVPFRVPYTEKKCTICGKIKLLKEFSIDKKNKNNLSAECRKCCKIRGDEWREKNPEYIKKYRVNYYKDNLENIKEYRSQPEVKTRKNKQAKKRRETDIACKINETMRNAINHSLKGNKNGRHWESLVGYTLDEYKRHMESLFTEGMTWENYGHGKYEWNLDHVIPVSKFNITSTKCQDFKDCWALKNLQPLWAVRNYEKNNRPMEPKYLIKPDCIK